MKASFIFFLSLAALLIGCAQTPNRTTAAESGDEKIVYSDAHINFKKWQRNADCCTARGKKIGIASGGPNSSKCGLEIHDKGGNIVDAAVATAFCLAVERPHSAGLGGGAFLTLHLVKEKHKDYFIDFRETAPHAAKRDMFLDAKGNVVPDLSLTGGLSIAVPGFVSGLYDVHKRWGKLKWAEVIGPAIRLAKEGFPVYPSLSAKIVDRKEALLKDPYLAKLFIPNGTNPLQVGDKLVQADLAQTLTLIAKEGKSLFYEGAIAKDIATTVKAHGGILTEKDLKEYRVQYRQPLKGTFKGYGIITAPPPSAGGVILLEILNSLNTFHISSAVPYSWYVNLLSEVMKRGFADRSQLIGDPDHFRSSRYLLLLQPEYTAAVVKAVNQAKATPSEKIKPGEFLKKESPDTTQLSLVDSEGNAVSSTMTINYYFGSGIGVPGRGIILNDEMDDFSVKPGVQNSYGLTGNEANEIAPNKRPVSSMTPTILVKGQKAVMAVGAPGGSHIISGVTEVILNNLLIYPGDLKRAVFAPHIHDQWVPHKLFLEQAGFPEATLKKLKEMGHTIETPAWTSLVAAVAWDDKKKDFIAVFDPRDLGGAEAR